MALKANYDFLFVGKDDNSYLENYSYDLYDKHGDKSGEIFINVEIQNNPANSEEIGEAVFATFQKEFFAEIEKDPYERFETALKATNAVLEDFKSQKVSGYIGNLNMVIAAFVQGTLYISQSGDAEAYLCRKKFISIITEGLFDEESKDVFSNIASGSLEAGDSVLISSTRLLRYITKNDLGRLLSGEDPTTVLGEVRDVVATEMLGRAGLTCVLFSDTGVAEEEVKTAEEHDSENDDFQNPLIDSLAAVQRTATSSGGVSRVRTVVSKVFYVASGAAKNAFSKVSKRSLKTGRASRDMRSSVSGFGAKFTDLRRGLFKKGLGGKKLLLAFIVVVVVLVAGVWIVADSRAKQAEIAALDTLLIDVQNRIADAETKGQYDKEAAGQILAKAQEDAVKVLNSGNFRDKASILLQQIEETRDVLDGVKRIKDAKLLVDLTSKRSTVSALGFVAMATRLFAFEYNALYEIILDQVQDPITLDDTETVIAATAFPERNSYLFLTKSGKIIEYKEGTKSYMDTEEGQFRKGAAIETWGNNVYILDPDSNQIWKYIYRATTNRFSSSVGYATADAQFALAKDFAIDSSVWVLNADGIDKYYGGVKQTLTISKKPFNAFKDASKIVTAESMSEIYVLDAKSSRILVFYKDANSGNLIYDKQYVVDGVGEIRDIFVDQTSKRIKVLTPTKVYEFDMA